MNTDAVITNIPRPGETPDQILARSVEGRAELNQREAPKADPAPSSLELATTQISHLLSGMSANPIEQLRQLRDEIDDTIRGFQENEGRSQ